MTISHYIGAALVLAFISLAGLYSGRRVKSAGDFASGGRQAGAGIVAGSIIGTLVGGAATIGTAQLAFSYGFSAWWFTLGGSLGCLALALVFAQPLYESGIRTLPQVFSRAYGDKAGTAAAFLTSLGSFVGIVSQTLSGIVLITSVSPLSPLSATLITVLLMLCYVVFGGAWGAGIVGIFKTITLALAVGGCGLLALAHQGGFAAFYQTLPHDQYFNLFARGLAVDLGSGLSLILGVLSTQAYIQAVISAKSLRLAKAGTLASVVIVPCIGVGSIFIGMYMKLNHPEISSGSALPMFILEKLPAPVAGAVLAVLLVALVGTGAGMALGLSTMVCNDIYKVYIHKEANDKKTLQVNRMLIVITLAIAAFCTGGNAGALILNWGFLSMGLRGAVAFVPLCAALFAPGRLSPKAAIMAMVLGPVLVVVGRWLLPPQVDSLFLGVAGSLLVVLVSLKKTPGELPPGN